MALGLILAVSFASAADALRIRAAHLENALALTAAAAMCWTGYGLAFVPVAALLGTSAHIAGDMLTRCGCPLLWPVTMREFHLLPRPLRFTTGHWPETLVVTPVLLAALGLLALHDTALITHIHPAVSAGS